MLGQHTSPYQPLDCRVAEFKQSSVSTTRNETQVAFVHFARRGNAGLRSRQATGVHRRCWAGKGFWPKTSSMGMLRAVVSAREGHVIRLIKARGDGVDQQIAPLYRSVAFDLSP